MESIPQGIHPSWIPHLTPLFESEYMKKLKYEVLPNCKFYPHKQDIFNVFSMSLQDIRVVILGQDPYPKPRQAIGYAFAVPEDIFYPTSLKVIVNEVIRERGLKQDMKQKYIPLQRWRTLEHWREQGVFLLNSSLTVEAGKPNSHEQYWLWFTHKVVEIISKQVNPRPIWLLWGVNARAKAGYIQSPMFIKQSDRVFDLYRSSIMTKYHNSILTAPHPAAESYNPNGAKFTGCNHFQLTNQILEQRGQQPINW